MSLESRISKLEALAGGDTAQRRRLAAIVTALVQSLDPDAPAVRPEDLPPEWTCYGDLVAASYVLDEVEPQSENPPAGP